MKRLVAIAFILGLSGSAAQALPLVPGQAPANMTIKVEGGCGPGFHRGPYGGCQPNHRPVVVVPGAVLVAPAAAAEGIASVPRKDVA